MNKRERELLESQLTAEEKELRKLKIIYSKALSDIDDNVAKLLGRADADLQHVIYQIEYQKALKKQISGILDDMNSKRFESITQYMSECYENGFIGTMYDIHGQDIPIIMPIDQEKVIKAMKTDSKISKGLYARLGEDADQLKKRIANNLSRGIASNMSYAEIARNIRGDSNVSYNNAARIARTEGHRVHMSAAYDAQIEAKKKGAKVVKQWDSSLDKHVRDSHRRVDGEIREVEEKFSNGLMFPSDPSGEAAEVINCRCTLFQRAKWGLDEEELETLKERAAYYELDKSENFNDFKKKYLKAAEEVVKATAKVAAVEGAAAIARNSAKETPKVAEEVLENTAETVYNNVVEIDSNKVFEAAKAGTRHAGVYRDAMNKTKKELEKSIASHNKEAELHADKIANPQKYDKGWESKTQQQKDGLIRKWQKDMQRNAEQAAIETEVYKERFGKNE